MLYSLRYTTESKHNKSFQMTAMLLNSHNSWMQVKVHGQKLWYHVKGLVTRNTNMKSLFLLNFSKEGQSASSLSQQELAEDTKICRAATKFKKQHLIQNYNMVWQIMVQRIHYHPKSIKPCNWGLKFWNDYSRILMKLV